MRKVTLLALFFVSISSLIHAPAKAEEKYVRPKVAIMPFELNAAADLAYLQAGVEAMLGSRLGSRGGVAVIDRQAVRKAMEDSGSDDPGVIGPAVGAELVLKGSITGLGNMISLDLRALRVSGEAADERFFATANSPGEVIAAIDQLVVEVGRNMFKGGLKQSGSEVRFGPVGPAQIEPPKVEKGAQESGGDQGLHPDRLFREQVPVAPAVPASSGAAGAGLPGRPEMISRSQSLDLEIQGLDIGDVFGDGSQVVIIAEEHQLHAYRQEGDKLVETGHIPAPPKFARVVVINLADLNGNGRAELYVSTISDNKPYSYVVEWDGKGFAALCEKQPWHLRPVNLPGRGLFLVGQRAEEDRPVREGLYILTMADGKLTAGEKLAVPDAVNLFEFTVADFNGDGQPEVAAVDDGGILSLYGADGEVLWRGSDKYAHTVRYIGKAGVASGGDKNNRNVPSRLISADVNGDGRPELVVMKNPSGVAALLKTIGSFTGGSVQFLAWNGISFIDIWNTGEIGSYLADYQMTMSPAGTPSRLYLGLVTKKSGLSLGDYRSVLATYPLGAGTK